MPNSWFGFGIGRATSNSNTLAGTVSSRHPGSQSPPVLALLSLASLFFYSVHTQPSYSGLFTSTRERPDVSCVYPSSPQIVARAHESIRIEGPHNAVVILETMSLTQSAAAAALTVASGGKDKHRKPHEPSHDRDLYTQLVISIVLGLGAFLSFCVCLTCLCW